ncbi:hypothetical protein [Actinomadura madurae]|uniref:hypothetical protein n=1 Tax=Actinomadura madurae TaxID=1993 RepID=UPI0020D22296|nr:hypothetical protein [Actinomadura madurae]MCQ0011739.1 hypothetical protein [Actinomadura madurae]
MSESPDPVSDDAARLCEEARDLAENGDAVRAALLFEKVLALGDTPCRAQAALGLAVVLDDAGEVERAREADRAAIATADPEYGPRAAYHLALTHERAGEPERAAPGVAGRGRLRQSRLPPAGPSRAGQDRRRRRRLRHGARPLGGGHRHR